MEVKSVGVKWLCAETKQWDQVLEPSEEPQLLSSHVPTVSEISMPGDLITMAFAVCIFEGCHHPGDSHPTKDTVISLLPNQDKGVPAERICCSPGHSGGTETKLSEGSREDVFQSEVNIVWKPR